VRKLNSLEPGAGALEVPSARARDPADCAGIMMNRADFASLGFGVGLRRPHYLRILDDHPPMDWFEVISENFMVEGGRPLEVLEGVRSHYRS
jgi:Protein of unknown function (DUF692)